MHAGQGDPGTLGVTPRSLRRWRVSGSEHSSSIRTCAIVAGQSIAPTQFLLTEWTLKVGLLVTGENVALKVVPTVEARLAVGVLTSVLFRGRLWEVEVVWVRRPPGRRAWLQRGVTGEHVGTWCHRPLQRVLRERERVRLAFQRWSTDIEGAGASETLTHSIMGTPWTCRRWRHVYRTGMCWDRRGWGGG